MVRHAYDYADQKWVEGAQASRILLAQAREELHIMQGPRRAGYIMFIQSKHTPDEYVRILKSEIQEFEHELEVR